MNLLENILEEEGEIKDGFLLNACYFGQILLIEN